MKIKTTEIITDNTIGYDILKICSRQFLQWHWHQNSSNNWFCERWYFLLCQFFSKIWCHVRCRIALANYLCTWIPWIDQIVHEILMRLIISLVEVCFLRFRKHFYVFNFISYFFMFNGFAKKVLHLYSLLLRKNCWFCWAIFHRWNSYSKIFLCFITL